MRKLFLVCIMLAVSISAQAAPVALTSAAFLPTDTLVNFNSATNEAAIGNLYSGMGVNFSGALYGLTNVGDTQLFPSNGGGVIASNWLYSRSSYGGLSFTATFSSLHTRVGFWLENWPNQNASVELFRGTTSIGTLVLANTSGLAAEFRGIGDLSGFDSIVFTNTTDTNGFFAIDDFVFGGTSVPEPATGLTLIAGLGTLGLLLRRQKVETF